MVTFKNGNLALFCSSTGDRILVKSNITFGQDISENYDLYQQNSKN